MGGTMPISEEDLKKIVTEVVRNLESSPAAPAPSSDGPVFDTVDEAVNAAEKAQPVFQDLGLEARKKIIAAMRGVSRANARRWAEMAVSETGMGRVEDKVTKNLVSADKTPGVEDLRAVAYTGDKGLALVEYAPFGVVAAITPSTNAVATIISNAIGILAAGNSVVFSPHPAAKGCVADAVRVLDKAIVSAGGPVNLITTIAKPTQEATKQLLSHPKGRMNMVTGGPAIVKVAMTAGKACKTIAAGPGNPPIVVDETAVFPDCAKEIIFGCGFDNNVLCIAEKEVIVVEAARARFLEAMRQDGRAYELTRAQMDALAKVAIPEPGREPKVNRAFIGRNPSVIAKAIGLDLSDEVRVLWGEVPNDHPFVVSEQLMPVLPVTTAKDIDAAIELARLVEWDNHHSAGLYSTNVKNMTKMGRRMACSIFVKNGCTLHGLGLGEGYASMSIGTPTGDGITKTSHFVRPLQCSVVGDFRIA
ncbi:MAG: aldehyde dehydrogenase EutE [Elusimicrobia bacterium CG08_land_8_20_14_0_20_59_10]|nr:MAG: aldehyde dehydrogenase EutE [Elusimicrobia bacterium CG08_land_8_20_14_0_20_59_10]